MISTGAKCSPSRRSQSIDLTWRSRDVSVFVMILLVLLLLLYEKLAN